MFTLVCDAPLGALVASTTGLPVASTTGLPVSSTTGLPVSSTTGLPVSSTTGLPVSSTTGLPVSSTTGLPVSSTTGLPVSSTTGLPVGAFGVGASVLVLAVGSLAPPLLDGACGVALKWLTPSPAPLNAAPTSPPSIAACNGLPAAAGSSPADSSTLPEVSTDPAPCTAFIAAPSPTTLAAMAADALFVPSLVMAFANLGIPPRAPSPPFITACAKSPSVATASIISWRAPCKAISCGNPESTNTL